MVCGRDMEGHLHATALDSGHGTQTENPQRSGRNVLASLWSVAAQPGNRLCFSLPGDETKLN